jgi:GTP-binding protein Era
MIETAYRAGFVAVMGRPNVGKSTLINALLGQKIAAVSPRPQTTRRRQLGILTVEQAQVVFIDTPGLHRPRHKLGESMNREAQAALEHADLVLFIVDASALPDDEDRMLAGYLQNLRDSPPILLVLNKSDLVPLESRDQVRQTFQQILPPAMSIWVSAQMGENLPLLLETIVRILPEGEPFFPADQVTDLYEKEIAADLIRETCLNLLRDEVPHGIAVRIDEYIERGEAGAYIAATLFLERESHKPIVIGQNGSMLKRIGSLARQEIEAMSGRKVYLELRVKVRKNWRDDEKAIRQMYS